MAIKFLNSVNADSGVLYVDAANDRVGIGTTSPSIGLDVRPIARFWHGSSSNYTQFSNGNEINTFDSAGANTVMYLQYRSGSLNVGAGTLFVQSGNGNVGIGTTNPLSKLHVSADGSVAKLARSTAQYFDFNMDAANNNLDFYVGSNGKNVNLTIKGSHNGAMTFGTQDTERMRIDSAGNVGIGTTSPGAKLDIQGELHLYDNGNVSYVESQNQPLYLTSASDLRINAQQTGGDIYLDANGFIKFREAGSDVMAIDGGNVGIGTTSPDVKLEVVEASPTNGIVADFVNSTNAGNTVAAIKLSNADSDVCDVILGANRIGANFGSDFFISPSDGVDGTNRERFRITEAGNVGIGTASPSSKLDIDGGNTGNSLFVNGYVNGSAYGISDRFVLKSATRLWFYDSNTQIYRSGTALKMYGNDGVIFETNANERMRIASNGNVGIGTTAPSTKFHVRNGEATIASDTDGVKLSYSSGNSSGIIDTAFSDNNLEFRTNGTAKMWIANGGNVGIGTTSPAQKLHVVGTSNFQGAVQVAGGTFVDSARRNIYIDSFSAGGGAGIFFRDGFAYNASITAEDHNGASADGICISGYDGVSFSTGANTRQERMRITSAGNVGIGTTSPAKKLVVAASSQTWASAPQIAFYDTTSGQTAARNWTVGAISTNWGNFTIASSTAAGGDPTTARFTIDNAGNVGIGTTSPLYKLDVASGSSSSAFGLSLSGTARLKMYADGTYNYFAAQSGQSHRFTTTGGAEFLISNGGNVGIGTTSPTAPLHVIGTVRMGNTSDGLTFTSGSGIGNIIGVDTGFAGYNAVAIKASANTGIYLDTADNVGIGTTSPASKLHVYDSSNAYVNIQTGGGSYAYLRLNTPSSGDGYLIKNTGTGNSVLDKSLYLWNSDGPIQFVTDETLGNTVTIDTSGNVGIGTDNPAQKLHVVGDTRIEGNLTVNGTYTQIDTDTNTTEQWNVTNDGTGPAVTINQTGAQDIMDVQDDGTSVFYIEDGGNVGIGTNDPEAELHVHGTGSTSSGNNYHLIVDDDNSYGINKGGGVIFRGDYNSSGAKANFGAIRAGKVNANDGNANAYLSLLYGSSGSLSEGLRLDYNGKLKFNQYGSNSFTGTAAYALAVDSSGNVIETSYIPSSSSTDFVAVTGDTMSGNLILNDNVELRLGTSSDFKAGHTGSYTYMYNYTGHMYLRNFADNSDIIFQTDDGSGGYASYFTLDGSTGHAYFSNYGNVGIGTSSPNAPLHIQEAVDSLTTVKGITLSTSAGGTNKYLPAIVWSYGANGTPDFAKIEAQRGSGTSGRIAFSTANSSGTMSEAIRIDGDGNVGIGTTSPASTLHVSSTSPIITISNSDTSLVDGQVIGQVDFKSLDGSSNMTNVFGSIRTEAQGTLDNGVNDGGKMVFSTFKQSTTLVDQMVIDRDGNVGIGTTSPDYKLEVEDTIGIKRLGVAATSTIQQTGAGFTINAPSGYHSLIVQNNGTEYARVNSSGNVGIGTTSPGNKLTINDTLTNGLKYPVQVANITGGDGAGTSAGILFNVGYGGTSRGKGALVYNSNGTGYNKGDFMFLQSSVADTSQPVLTDAVVTIKNNGNVGIGTASPSEKLNIYTATGRNFKVNQSTANVTILENDYELELRSGGGYDLKLNANGSSTYGNVTFRTDGSERMRITSGGNVGIGTTSPSYKLEVSGKIATPAGAIVIEGQEIYANSEYSGNDGSVRINRFGYLGGQTKFRDTVIYNGKGNQIMTIDGSTSSVGIGTTSPNTPLDIVANSGGNSLNLRMRATSDDYSFIQGKSHDGTEIIGEIAFNRTAATTGNMLFYTSNGTNSQERLRITSGGNVGIGTSAPVSKLDIRGRTDINLGGEGLYFKAGGDNANNGRPLEFTSSSNNGSNGALHTINATSGNGAISLNTAGVSRIYMDRLGNVGIGTTSPTLSPTSYTGGLHVENDTYIQARLSSSSSGAGLEFIPSSGDHWEIQAQTGNSLIFYNRTDSSYRMVIEGNGNVGIGTTNPSAKMHIGPDTLVSGYTPTTTTLAVSDITNGAELILRGQSPRLWFDSTAGGNGEIYMDGSSLDILSGTPSSAGSSRFNIDSSGNIQIGAYGAGYLKTDASGNITVDTSTIEDTLDSVTDRGAATTNDIEVGNITTKNDSGIYSFSDTVDASASEDVFSISNDHGAQAFRVTFVCNTTDYSVAKTYEVVHAFSKDPVFFKVVDTGAWNDGSADHDFDASFATEAGGATANNKKIICTITNNSTTTNADIATTVFLGGSPTAITVTAL